MDHVPKRQDDSAAAVLERDAAFAARYLSNDRPGDLDEILKDEDSDRMFVIGAERRRQQEADPTLRFLRQQSVRLSEPQRGLIQATRKLGYRTYVQMSEPEEMQLVANLIRATGAKRVMEIGALTGYSALTMASALPADGRLVVCDITSELIDVGRPFWREAGVEGKIDVRLAPATETMQALLSQGQKGLYDLIFIDADKNNYDHYYELGLQLLRPRGIAAISNMYYYGTLMERRVQDSWTVALRSLSEKLRQDPRVDLSLLRMGDGLCLAVKR